MFLFPEIVLWKTKSTLRAGNNHGVFMFQRVKKNGIKIKESLERKLYFSCPRKCRNIRKSAEWIIW
jgi:hypothetical protein